MNKARILRVSSRILKSFAIFYLVSWMVCSAWVWHRRNEVSQNWSRVQLPLEGFQQQFPVTQPNTTALKLQEIGRRLDLFFIPTEANKTKAATDQMLKTSRLMGDYFTAQFDKNSTEIDPFPAELEQYLTDHAADLAAVKEILAKNPAPVWEMDLARAEWGFMPNFLAQRGLTRLLATDIFRNTRNGNDAEALKTFELSWKANESLRHRPELMSQFIAVANDGFNLSTLAKMNHVPAEWQQRIAAHDYHKSVALALETETWMVYERTKSGEIIPPGTEADLATNKLFRSTVVALTKPYLKVFMLDLVDKQQQALVACRNHGPHSLERFGTPDLGWNPVSNLYLPNASAAWRSMSRYLMEVEKTQKVLQIKAEAAQSADNRLPNTVSGIESSDYPSGMWSYAVAPDGTATLSFNQKLESRPVNFTFKSRT